MDAQADPSLRWAQSHCWFCHVVAQMSLICLKILLPFQHCFTLSYTEQMKDDNQRPALDLCSQELNRVEFNRRQVLNHASAQVPRQSS